MIEWTQSRKLNYEFKTTTIENDKSRYFKSELSINDELVAKGEGVSKKRAEQAAAKTFFDEGKSNY